MDREPDSTPSLLDHALVECPRCERQATITVDDAPRVTCGHCGYVRDGPPGRLITWWSVRQDGRDPLFGLPLWLTAECCGGELLWALNHAHLSYLARFVASKQRDREEVLKTIERLGDRRS
jgi:hypothetical protein